MVDRLKKTTQPARNPQANPVDRLIVLSEQLAELATQVQQAATELREEMEHHDHADTG